MRLLVSLVLCSVLPGWGLCEKLCRTTGETPAACCAEISVVSCCHTPGSADSGDGVTSSSMSCGCAQHSMPSQDKTSAPTAPTTVEFAEDSPAAASGFAQGLVEAQLVLAQSRPATREILSLHHRLNI